MIITVDRDELLKILKFNRSKHREIFEKALEGFRKQCIEALERKIEKIKEGKLETVSVNFPIPEDHTQDYDRIIKMIELNIIDEIELAEDESAMYIMDDWAWKRQWSVSNTAYLNR
jgi:hypothetical protein